MARNLGNNDLERLRRIKIVGDYVFKTEATIIKTQKYISENYFPISVYTVKTYLDAYKKLDMEKYGELERIKNAHLESRLDDKKTIERIKKIVHMYLVEGKNLDEIAKILEVSYDIVYRDMTNRLPKINENLARQVSQEFNRRKLLNLGKRTKNK